MMPIGYAVFIKWSWFGKWLPGSVEFPEKLLNFCLYEKIGYPDCDWVA